MLLKMLHNRCNTAVLGVLLIYPHSPSGAVRPRELCVYISQAPRGHVTIYYYASLCSHSNNTSSMNPTSKCHTCSQGYKYKWLMPYSQGVGCLHLPTIFK